MDGDIFAGRDTKTAESLTENNEQSSAVREAVAKLPRKKRDVVSRFYVAGQSIAAIAIALNIPEGTVKSQLSAARMALATLISEPQ